MKGLVLRLAGLLLALGGIGAVAYTSYTVWAADRAAQSAQERLNAQFEQQLPASSTLPLGGLEEDPTVGVASTPPPATITTTPGEDAPGPDLGTVLPAVIGEMPPLQGSALGRMIISDVGVNWMVVEGVTREVLTTGPGHMPGTPLPGQPGNAVISGHRTTHGAPFHDLHLLEPGDAITIETTIGTHVYQVVEVTTVVPTALWVTDQVPGAWLTLTSCHPIGSSQERIIVFARLVGGPNADAIAATLNGTEGPPQPG